MECNAMYICMYVLCNVCVHARARACMHACMHVCMSEFLELHECDSLCYVISSWLLLFEIGAARAVGKHQKDSSNCKTAGVAPTGYRSDLYT
jgi:hypothetical protein